MGRKTEEHLVVGERAVISPESTKTCRGGRAKDWGGEGVEVRRTAPVGVGKVGGRGQLFKPGQ